MLTVVRRCRGGGGGRRRRRCCYVFASIRKDEFKTAGKLQ
jgi:hypothetical protein